MAHLGLAPVRTPRHATRALVRRMAGALRDRLRRQAAYTRTLAELHAMSDRELSDFGFHRSELPRVARNAVRDH